MPRHSPTLGLLLIATFGATTAQGCGHGISLQHPATSGALTAATVERADFFAENRTHVPRGTLKDSVTLARFDGASVCFDADLRDFERRQVDLAQMSNIELEYNDGTMSPTRVTPRSPTSQSVEGHVVESRSTGQWEEVCREENENMDCIRWGREEIFEDYNRPVRHSVHSGGGILCFDHGGAITTENDELELSIGGGSYQFDLEGAADDPIPWPMDASGQPRAITAPGYESLAYGVATTPAVVPPAPEPFTPQLPAELRDLANRPVRLVGSNGDVLVQIAADGRILNNGGRKPELGSVEPCYSTPQTDLFLQSPKTETQRATTIVERLS